MLLRPALGVARTRVLVNPASCPSCASWRLLSSAPLSSSQLPVQFTPREMTPELVRRIGEREAALRAAYDALPSSFPATGDVPAPSRVEAIRKRLLYRSKQRGWLEVDLLMGAFATARLGSLTADELSTYERLLNRETLDIYNLITGKDAPTDGLEGPLLDEIKAFVAASPLGKASPAAYASSKGTYSN